MQTKIYLTAKTQLLSLADISLPPAQVNKSEVVRCQSAPEAYCCVFLDNELSCGQQLPGSNSLAHHFKEVIGKATRALDITLTKNLTAPRLGLRRMWRGNTQVQVPSCLILKTLCANNSIRRQSCTSGLHPIEDSRTLAGCLWVASSSGSSPLFASFSLQLHAWQGHLPYQKLQDYGWPAC